MADAKKPRKRDFLWAVLILAAAFALVVVAARFIEYRERASNSDTPPAASDSSDSENDLVMPEDTGAPSGARPAANSSGESGLPHITDDGYNYNIKNIVLIGVDKQELGENPSFRSGGQSDVIMIVSMNLKEKEYFILSVNRDLAVPVENYSEDGHSYGFVDEQIALSYAYGDGSRASGRNVLKSLKALLGEDIPFQGFIAAPMPIIGFLADAVDGVEVTIKDDFTGVDDTLKMGETVVLRGEQAETFVRARMSMPGDTHNAARMTRQIDFLNSFVKKAKETMTAQQIADLYSDAMDMFVTDLGSADITKWILTGYDFEFKGFYRIDGTEGESKNGARCTYPDYDEVEKLVQELYCK